MAGSVSPLSRQNPPDKDKDQATKQTVLSSSEVKQIVRQSLSKDGDSGRRSLSRDEDSGHTVSESSPLHPASVCFSTGLFEACSSSSSSPFNPLTTVVAGEQQPPSSKGDVRLTTTIEETSIKGGGTSRRQVVNPLTTKQPRWAVSSSSKGDVRLTTMIEGTFDHGSGASRRQVVQELTAGMQKEPDRHHDDATTPCQVKHCPSKAQFIQKDCHAYCPYHMKRAQVPCDLCTDVTSRAPTDWTDKWEAVTNVCAICTPRCSFCLHPMCNSCSTVNACVRCHALSCGGCDLSCACSSPRFSYDISTMHPVDDDDDGDENEVKDT